MRQNRSYHFIDQKKLKHVQYIMKYNWSLIVNEKAWLQKWNSTTQFWEGCGIGKNM